MILWWRGRARGGERKQDRERGRRERERERGRIPIGQTMSKNKEEKLINWWSPVVGRTRSHASHRKPPAPCWLLRVTVPHSQKQPPGVGGWHGRRYTNICVVTGRRDGPLNLDRKVWHRIMLLPRGKIWEVRLKKKYKNSKPHACWLVICKSDLYTSDHYYHWFQIFSWRKG